MRALPYEYILKVLPKSHLKLSVWSVSFHVHSLFSVTLLQGSRGDPGDAGLRGDAGVPGPKVIFDQTFNGKKQDYTYSLYSDIVGISRSAQACFDSGHFQAQKLSSSSITSADIKLNDVLSADFVVLLSGK